MGIDGVIKERYGANLEDNLKDLSERLRRQGYRPQIKRRSYIPKLRNVYNNLSALPSSLEMLSCPTPINDAQPAAGAPRGRACAAV